MKKIIFIFMMLSIVSFSENIKIFPQNIPSSTDCPENGREHLEILKNEKKKMNEIYNKLIQKFDKNKIRYSKLKQNLINSQEMWIKNSDEEMENFEEYTNWINLCMAEKSRTESWVSLIQQRILELTNEYKKYLD